MHGKVFLYENADAVTFVVGNASIAYVVVVSARAHTRYRDTVNRGEQNELRSPDPELFAVTVFAAALGALFLRLRREQQRVAQSAARIGRGRWRFG